MKTITYIITLLLISSGVPYGTLAANDSIKIGLLLPLTGRLAPMGRIQQKSFQMAAGEVNAAGGINGKKIELIVADTRGNPDAGRAAVEQLIHRDRVLVIGGGFSSTATWAAISIAQEEKIPFLVNSAAADKITEQGWPYIFRLNQPVSERLDALASFLTGVAADIKSVAILHAHSLQPSATARIFFIKAKELGLRPVIRERFEDDARDYQALLTRVKAKNPDLIYAAADSVRGAALLVRRSRELKLNPKLFIGEGNGFVQPEFATQAAKASDHIVCPALWAAKLPYSGAGAFNEKFIAAHNTPPEHYGAEAYAGITVIADALKRTRVLAPGNVRDALTKTSRMTVLGPVKFVSYNNKSQQNRLPTYLVQWINGKLEIVWPQHLATQKVFYPAP
jgi:branched-chain amino acid transport system substrate-binding protein